MSETFKRIAALYAQWNSMQAVPLPPEDKLRAGYYAGYHAGHGDGYREGVADHKKEAAKLKPFSFE